MKLIKFIPIAFALLLTAACSSVRVNTDYDKSANFTAYKTYAFLKEGVDAAQINDIDKKRILNSIDAELTAKGFVKSNDNPDFVISIFTLATKNVNVTHSNYYSPWGYYGYGPYWGPQNTNISTHIEGTLYIDIFDTKNKSLVWQGTGIGLITPNQKSEKKEERIKEFAQKVLSTFPPTK
ncbi:DUF4136 domain-containing protein [Myroides sp. LoEW2-1]|uniref:DUF4136 domain-containing protein n=1 Tax=Myroides sp. LoEW2-1 TaxID=2683192 RepID=UPI001329BAA8|nr:DUF4136 domain-containing protein [Myroides sp. LoEW2-1]MVX35492.1 DUF4136 domain-containing protein [Myroides sp. LoEW2-1]